MSVATTTAPSPGWYPDPQGSGHLRWWDGDGWSEHVTDAPRDRPRDEPEAFPDVPFVASVLPDEYDLLPEDDDLIEFSWDDPTDGFLATFEDEFDPEPEPESVREPEPVFEPRAALPAFEPQPAPSALPAPPAPPAPPRSRAIPRPTIKGAAGLIVCAAVAAQVTNLIGGDDTADRPAAQAGAIPAMSAADRTCLKEWNTTASGTAAELRVTLGQFTGAYARVASVAPLPGTLMAPDSCALTVYDPGTDTNLVFVSGVPDQVGYSDATSYPRAKDYGWPKSAKQANVSVREDGTIIAL